MPASSLSHLLSFGFLFPILFTYDLFCFASTLFVYSRVYHSEYWQGGYDLSLLCFSPPAPSTSIEVYPSVNLPAIVTPSVLSGSLASDKTSTSYTHTIRAAVDCSSISISQPTSFSSPSRNLGPDLRRLIASRPISSSSPIATSLASLAYAVQMRESDWMTTDSSMPLGKRKRLGKSINSETKDYQHEDEEQVNNTMKRARFASSVTVKRIGDENGDDNNDSIDPTIAEIKEVSAQLQHLLLVIPPSHDPLGTVDIMVNLLSSSSSLSAFASLSTFTST